MRTVANLLRASERVNIEDLVRQSLIDAGEDYVRIQREQLGKGETSEGKPITNQVTGSDEYSHSYARKKGRTKPIDLHDKGDFWSEIFITEDKAGAFVDSSDSKSGMLQERYSTKIFGLNDDSKNEFKPALEIVTIKNLTTELNRK